MVVGRAHKLVERWGRMILAEVVPVVDGIAGDGSCYSVDFLQLRVRIRDRIEAGAGKETVSVLAAHRLVGQRENSDEIRLRYRQNEGLLLFPYHGVRWQNETSVMTGAEVEVGAEVEIDVAMV